MRPQSAVTCAALITFLASACDVHVDVDHDRDRQARSETEPLPEAGSGTEVWLRESSLVVVDEPLDVHLELRLRPEGTFVFAAEFEDGDGDHERTVVEGSYRWDGDRLTLVDDGGETRVLSRRGDELELETDWRGDVLLAVTRLPDPALRRAR